MNKNVNAPSCMSVVLIALIIICLMNCRSSSTYKLSPAPLKVKESEKSFDDLVYDIKCVPGPDSTAGYYTTNLTPGGYCLDQDMVNSAIDYEILDGIGGSLLDN